MKHTTFATCINCIDGRVQEPVIAFIKERFTVDYVDMVTEPGPDHIVARSHTEEIITALKRCIEISITKHHSRLIVIAGHDDCAAHPVDHEAHMRDIIASVEVIKTWGFGVEVMGLWVDADFNVHEMNE